jgi:hypothetical protein
LAERGSPAIAVVRAHQPEGVARQKISSERTGESATARLNANGSILPDSLQKAAATLAEASRISLDQFIAAAVGDNVGGFCAAAGLVPDSPVVAAVRRPYGSMSVPNAEIQEAGLANGDPEARYWRRPSAAARDVRRAATIKKRSAKFPYFYRTES